MVKTSTQSVQSQRHHYRWPKTDCITIASATPPVAHKNAAHHSSKFLSQSANHTYTIVYKSICCGPFAEPGAFYDYVGADAALDSRLWFGHFTEYDCNIGPWGHDVTFFSLKPSAFIQSDIRSSCCESKDSSVADDK